MEALDKFLSDFLKVMSAEARKEFKRYCLDPLFSLMHVKLETTLLTAATYFWDPQLHVFRFNYEELCPTMEEFCALYGVSPAGPFILPTPRSSYLTSFSNFLGISQQEVSILVKDHMVNLMEIATSFLAHDSKGNLNFNLTTQRALAFCLIGRFLISTGTLYVPIQICELIPFLLEHNNLIPMVLAETLNSLDKVHDNPQAPLGGSPILLQMWLLEKLNFLSPTTINPYKPQHYCCRRVELPGQFSLREWLGYFQTLSWRNIKWFVFIWGCKEQILLRTSGCAMVKLIGLRSTSFYWTSRILRQMGAMQTIPTSMVFDHSVEPVGPTMIKWAQTRWTDQLKLTRVENTDGPYVMSPEYKTWLKNSLGVRETIRRERIYDLIKDTRLGFCREDILEAVEAAQAHDLRKKRRLERREKKANQETLKKNKRT